MMRGGRWKWRTWKWRTIEMSRHEIDGHEIDGPNVQAWKWRLDFRLDEYYASVGQFQLVICYY